MIACINESLRLACFPSSFADKLVENLQVNSAKYALVKRLGMNIGARLLYLIQAVTLATTGVFLLPLSFSIAHLRFGKSEEVKKLLISVPVCFSFSLRSVLAAAAPIRLGPKLV